MPIRPYQHEDVGGDFDPSVDILVGLLAIVLLVTIMLVPLVNLRDDLEAHQNLTHDGRSVLQLFAHHQTLSIANEAERVIYPIDDLLGNPALRDSLWVAQADLMHPAIFVDPDGLEAAFLIETILADVGFEDVSRIYLDAR